ncbi:hypothetical protein B0O99DRAFT_594738 [Bisporella sp. PMI_857]|nr:hypothetical protein B0O99DRAFT_594738 [Bisporella sp. PMI_857]
MSSITNKNKSLPFPSPTLGSEKQSPSFILSVEPPAIDDALQSPSFKGLHSPSPYLAYLEIEKNQLQDQKSQLQERIRILEELVQKMYRQSLLDEATINHYKVYEREVQSGIENIMRIHAQAKTRMGHHLQTRDNDTGNVHTFVRDSLEKCLKEIRESRIDKENKDEENENGMDYEDDTEEITIRLG